MYSELHCHSAFSFLDGASPPDEVLAEAHRLGYPALALTDRNGVYGSLAFAHAARALGIQAITGAEVSLTDGNNVVLLAESAQGYSNLCRLLTGAHLGAERLDPRLALSAIADRQDGLIILSGSRRDGCGDPRSWPRWRPCCCSLRPCPPVPLGPRRSRSS